MYCSSSPSTKIIHRRNRSVAKIIIRAIFKECKIELSSQPRLKTIEGELLKYADLVFTSGQSLYEVKKEKHDCINPFPSSINVEHFSRARKSIPQPNDQRTLLFQELVQRCKSRAT